MQDYEPEKYLKQALALAEERRGYCAPNPAVGAVLVKNGCVIGHGTHWACGEPHAEVMALREAGAGAQGAILYVTLEPCCHHGRTPPCTDLIVASGIKAVFYGQRDPNPRVSGGGEAQIKAAGIACNRVKTPEIELFYRSYCHWVAHKRPYVTVKLALSQDRKIAGPAGRPLAITGAGCQQLTHELRERSDAILTTSSTILNDDPQLNARLSDPTDRVVPKVIYILDSQCRLPLSARLFETAKSIVVFHSESAEDARVAALAESGVRCIPVMGTVQRLSLEAVLSVIGADGVHDLWVEAGAQCAASLMQEHRIDRLLLYCAETHIGPGVDAFPAGFLPQGDLALSSICCYGDMVFSFDR